LLQIQTEDFDSLLLLLKTIGGAMKMRSLLNSDVNPALPRCVPPDGGLR
jgi:hypothetical protein